MFDEILICLDGSALAEKILPLARGMASAAGAKITLLRVFQDAGELPSEEGYLRAWARRFGAEARFVLSDDPAAAIVRELTGHPGALAAMTTHGRTAWVEAVLGSVALRVLRGARRPVLLFRPLGADVDAPKKIANVLVALDGSDFSERIIPHAAALARAQSACLLLLQAFPPGARLPYVSERERSDIAASAYLHRKAGQIKRQYDIDCGWEVLHGEPVDAICRYVKDMADSLLAITTHARAGLERFVLGSVASGCVRRSGLPMLLYWPP